MSDVPSSRRDAVDHHVARWAEYWKDNPAFEPEVEGAITRMQSILKRLKRADAAIEAAVDRAVAELAVDSASPAVITFDALGYARLPAEIALRLIGRAVGKLGCEGPVELGKLEALMTALLAALDAAQKAGQKTGHKPGKVRFRRSLAGALVTLAGGKIAVEKAPPRRAKPLTTPGHGRASHAKTR